MKSITWLLALVPFLGFGQSSNHDVDNASKVHYDRKGEPTVQESSQDNQALATERKAQQMPASKLLKANNSLDFTKIGVSWYDLQTNDAVGRKVMVHDDGTISVVWTHDPNFADDNFGKRGTGYNYFDGNEWLKDPDNITRIEESRVGWSNVNVDRSGNQKEIFTVGHLAPLQGASGGYALSKNNGIGGDSFSTETREAGEAPIWYRTAQASGTFHMIGNFFTGDNDSSFMKGMYDPLVYYRSKDYGESWVDSQMILPGWADSSRRLHGRADNYAIDARDSMVVIALGSDFDVRDGGNVQDVTLWKSMDTGKTWSKEYIYKFPYTRSEWANDPPINVDSIQPLFLNDETISTVIDEEGTIHVSYGIRLYTERNAQGNLLRSTIVNGIHYWNSKADTIVEAGYMPGNEQNPLSTGIINTDSIDQTEVVVPDPSESRLNPYGNAPITTQPTLVSGGKDTLFLLYQSYKYGAILQSDEANYRDIYVNYSTDGGATWGDPQNVTNTAEGFSESAYPSAYRFTVDGKIHFSWMEDDKQGVFYNGPTYQNDKTENTIYYAALDVDSVLQDSVGNNGLSEGDGDGGGSGFARNESNFNIEAYPSPFREQINVSLELDSKSDVSVKLRDMVGKVQKEKDLGNVPKGNTDFRLNVNQLSKGVYFLELQVGDEKHSKKLIKQ